jgi:uncharacterized membrane protein YdbT with pleckstrin-like domain
VTAPAPADAHAETPPFFASPDQILFGYMLDEERLLYDEPPSFAALFVVSFPQVMLMLFAAIFLIQQGFSDNYRELCGLGLIAIAGYFWYKVIERFEQIYTRHVLTNVRIMRITGFFKRDMAFIPWAKVTDVRFSSTVTGRLLGYATVNIDSANEQSGLKEMAALKKVDTFKFWLVEGVRLKQGVLNASEIDKLEAKFPQHRVPIRTRRQRDQFRRQRRQRALDVQNPDDGVND